MSLFLDEVITHRTQNKQASLIFGKQYFSEDAEASVSEGIYENN